jgi:uncharacterized membrane protein YeaQ/YmgE (transglycosylase-associated protein family)
VIWTLLIAAILGAFVGAAARLLVPSRVKGGCGTNIAIGIVGSILGSMIFRFLGGVGFTGFNLWSFFVSLVGAVVFLLLYRAFSK